MSNKFPYELTDIAVREAAPLALEHSVFLGGNMRLLKHAKELRNLPRIINAIVADVAYNALKAANTAALAATDAAYDAISTISPVSADTNANTLAAITRVTAYALDATDAATRADAADAAAYAALNALYYVRRACRVTLNLFLTTPISDQPKAGLAQTKRLANAVTTLNAEIVNDPRWWNDKKALSDLADGIWKDQKSK